MTAKPALSGAEGNASPRPIPTSSASATANVQPFDSAQGRRATCNAQRNGELVARLREMHVIVVGVLARVDGRAHLNLLAPKVYN